jgi:hypothetical protein
MVRKAGTPSDFSSVRTGADLGSALEELFSAHHGSISKSGVAKRFGVQVSTVANWFSGSVPRDRDKFRNLLAYLQAYESEARQLLAVRDRLYELRQTVTCHRWRRRWGTCPTCMAATISLARWTNSCALVA